MPLLARRASSAGGRGILQEREGRIYTANRGQMSPTLVGQMIWRQQLREKRKAPILGVDENGKHNGTSACVHYLFIVIVYLL